MYTLICRHRVCNCLVVIDDFISMEYNIDLIMRKVSDKLIELRKQSGKSQIAVSHEINVSYRTYQRLENATLSDVKLSTILKILNHYDMSIEELLK